MVSKQKNIKPAYYFCTFWKNKVFYFHPGKTTMEMTMNTPENRIMMNVIWENETRTAATAEHHAL